MPTYANMQAQIKQQLLGFTKNQEQITWLSSAMSAVDTTFNVDTSTGTATSRGLVEIGDELILVSTYNKTSGLVNVAAGTNGRGREGTTPAVHSINDIVTVDPAYPRSRIQEAISQCMQADYPELYAIGSFEFKYRAARYEYEMPADMENLLRVTTDTIGPSKVWFPNQTVRFNPQASTLANEGSSTGKSLQVYDRIVPGRTIRVMYTKAPALMTNPSDDYATVTGLPESTFDVIVYGAAARLIGGLETGRLQQTSIEATERSQVVPAGSATAAANYFWRLHDNRLGDEMERLRVLYPFYQSFSS